MAKKPGGVPPFLAGKGAPPKKGKGQMMGGPPQQMMAGKKAPPFGKKGK